MLLCGTAVVAATNSGDDTQSMASHQAKHGGVGGEHDHHAAIAHALMAITFLAFLGVLGGRIARACKYPSVLGYLVAGILLNVVATLCGRGEFLLHLLEREGIVIAGALGVNLLMFRAGLEENVGEMVQEAKRGVWVALTGMVLPFIGGLVYSMLFLEQHIGCHLFTAASLTATSVGINVEAFKSLGYSGPANKCVKCAGGIDDVGGLCLLGAVSGIVATGMLDWAELTQSVIISLGFVVGSIWLGYMTSRWVSNKLAQIDASEDMKLCWMLMVGIGFGYAGFMIGRLEMIIGSFCGGLVLDAVQMQFADSKMLADLKRWHALLSDEAVRKEMGDKIHHEEHAGLESLIDGKCRWLIPLFFVMVGAKVDLLSLMDWKIFFVGAGATVLAIATKLPAGFFGPKGSRWIVAWAMVIRGEVGLIVANLALMVGAFNQETFGIIVFTMVLSTAIPMKPISILVRNEMGLQPA